VIHSDAATHGNADAVPVEAGRSTGLTADDLQTYIEVHGIAARLVLDLGDTSTVPLAAAALGVETERIIKSLLLLVRLPGRGDPPRGGTGYLNPQPVLVISNGERRVDYRAIAAHFGVGRKKVEFAPADVVLALFGYPAGGVPPFGHRTPVPVILDPAVLALPGGDAATVYGGGGDDSTMLEITVGELRRVVQPEILDTSCAPPAVG
jgi:prolyl-tRNA editing enzyme YbaK/EbsC (Cys-tRNA(Pro) deacylase)